MLCGAKFRCEPPFEEIEIKRFRVAHHIPRHIIPNVIPARVDNSPI